MAVSAELTQTLAETVALQENMAKRVIMHDEPPFDGTLVTGVDVTYLEDKAVACAVTMDLPRRRIVQIETRRQPCTVPYVRGFLQLREGPIVANLLKAIGFTGPILIDGNGILHPRRLGLASYLGVTMDRQTIGVAKSLLLGEIQMRHDDAAQIVDGDEVIGSALWLGSRKRPMFVSVGHRIALESALKVVRASSLAGFPEPLLRAHSISKSLASDAKGGIEH